MHENDITKEINNNILLYFVQKCTMKIKSASEYTETAKIKKSLKKVIKSFGY